ncbi:membrane protein insertase YidC [Apilactobacillus kunkeei]|uniref:membrane protein insertase YidC n=1 Tax=Apilactobacillus kunkeei TaxID=148814 RepID=UPI0006B24577|nr:membrane protein insertase YidC [Apilactobacillus kunkeei]KOY69775.1 Membrane protein insertase, YidC/Oxa1 family (Precursor) [Apilactobacillus kunkeei]MCK8629527.1 membrane protein insertase YidC [Apilactobacillus kunkeei]TMS99440.1 membrane protein insertase YidC [Apilactobacillus kunkeei]CAI2599776.1 Membrane protein insertase MisCB [Apilactobacillus kunkeei]CAI2599917.1 Membrane protein insertase MisCB [Apilactobacillus kunkeei]
MKKLKRFSALSLIGVMALVLSGCVRVDSNGKPYGLTYEYLALPGQHILDFIAKFFGGYGWAIIILTIIVRMILLPAMISQTKKSTIMQEKMSFIKPKMQEIQERQKNASSKEEQMKIQQEMMQLYKDNNISMAGGIGCLPLIIQMPIYLALYNGIRFSPEVSHTMFLGVKLGDKSLILVVLSFLAYVLQGYLMTLGLPEDQKKQMKMMAYFTPIMIVLVTFSAPAGLGIYFFISGLFACLQTLIINMYRPKIRAEVASQAAAQAQSDEKVILHDVEEEDSSEEHEQIKTVEEHDNHEDLRKRNSGKQNR